MKSRILSAVSISVFLLLYYTKDSKACFFYKVEGEEYRFGIFAPCSQQLHPYHGMSFCPFYMRDHDNQNGEDADQKKIIDEWFQYLGGKVDRKAIYELLDSVPLTVFSEALLFENDSPAGYVYKNAFYRYLLKPEHKKVLDYICYLKSTDSYMGSQGIDPWDNDSYITPPLPQSIMPCDGDLDSLDDNFLKMRYYFVNIRSHVLSLEPIDTAGHSDMGLPTLYEKMMKIPGSSIVKGWGAYYNALSVYRVNPAKGNFLMAQAFNLSDGKKAPIYRHFSRKLLNASARYAKTNKELANLYSLDAIENPGDAVNRIEQIYRLDPANLNLNFLMVREISKLEDRILTPKYTRFTAQVRDGSYGWGQYANSIAFAIADKAYLLKWKNFLTTALTDSLPKDNFFFDLCMAHTCLIDQKPDEAKIYLTDAKKHPVSDNELLYQYKLTELAATINGAEKLDDKFEAEILPTLKWLEKNKDHFENSGLVLKQVHLLISNKYQETGNIPRAIMTRLKYNWFEFYPTVAEGISFNMDSSLYFYMQEQTTGIDVEHFVKDIQRENKTPFEKYYLSDVTRGSYIWNMACEAAGSNYLREAEYSAALRMFSLIPDSYWESGYKGQVIADCLSTDPFIAHPEDNHRLSRAIRDSTHGYNKRTFAAHLVKLLKQDGNKPDSLLKIADAVYNMGYFGNSWILTRNSWSAFDGVFDRTEWGASNKFSPKYYDYYACRRARAWYQQAYYSSKNREVKAKALLMMAQCDKNYAYMLSPKRKSQSTALFDQFARSYADTRYYQDLTSECDIQEVKGYFYQFIP